MVESLKSWGVSTEDFDERGNKTLKDLHGELWRKDAVLIWDDVLNRAIRVAYSSKLLIKTPKGYLLEVGRQYGDGEPILNTRPWTVSGTRKRGENFIRAAIREARTEINLTIPESEIVPLSTLAEATLRESSVYPETMSLVIMKRHQWNTEKNLRRKIIKDTKVRVLLKVFPDVPLESWEDAQARELFKKIFHNMTIS